MAEDLDPALLRAFARTEGALAAEPFVSKVTARLQPGYGLHLGAAAVYSMIGTVLASVTHAILLPLRMRQTRLMTLGAAAATLVAAFF